MKTRDILKQYQELEDRWKFNIGNDLDYQIKLYESWKEFSEKEWV